MVIIFHRMHNIINIFSTCLSRLRDLPFSHIANTNLFILSRHSFDLNNHGTPTGACAIGRPCEIGKSTLTQNTCVSDAIKLWNQSPPSITTSKNMYHAKRAIKLFIKISTYLLNNKLERVFSLILFDNNCFI